MRPPSHGIDTTVALWEYYYRVRVPYMQSRTIEDIREKGTVVSGIAAYDADISNQMVTMYLTVDNMVEYYRHMVPLRVIESKDTKKIYEDVSAHLEAWKYQLDNAINIGDAPIEDLILLDRFAQTVYGHAKFEFRSENANSVFAQYLDRISLLNSSNFFTAPESQVTTFNKIDDNYETRDSLQDFFKTRGAAIRRF